MPVMVKTGADWLPAAMSNARTRPADSAPVVPCDGAPISSWEFHQQNHHAPEASAMGPFGALLHSMPSPYQAPSAEDAKRHGRTEPLVILLAREDQRGAHSVVNCALQVLGGKVHKHFAPLPTGGGSCAKPQTISAPLILLPHSRLFYKVARTW